MNKVLRQLWVFFLWVLVCVLAGWIVIVFRNALLQGLSLFYVKDSMPRAWQVRFLDRAFFVAAGLVILVFIFWVEGYLKDGFESGNLTRRFARVAGIEALILFIPDLFTSLIKKSLTGNLSLLVLVAEFIVGGALLAISIIIKHKRPKLAE